MSSKKKRALSITLSIISSLEKCNQKHKTFTEVVVLFSLLRQVELGMSVNMMQQVLSAFELQCLTSMNQ